ITGSQIPLAALRSDGQTNLLNALYIAANYPIPEVSLFFNNTLFRGNRATKADANGFDAFASPNFRPLLTAGIQIQLREGVLKPLDNTPLQLTPVSPQAVGVVTLYPGMAAEIFKNILQQPVKALILQTYGVGNAPQDKQLLNTLADGIANGTLIVNRTQCFKGRVNMGGYATGNALAEIGVISDADMTMEATLTKLHYLLSQDSTQADKEAFLQQNLRGELCP
ncbi:L-asparaginase 1, partial [Thalassospira xiamenensis]